MKCEHYLQDVAADERRRVAVLAVGPALYRATIHDKRLRYRGKGAYKQESRGLLATLYSLFLNDIC